MDRHCIVPGIRTWAGVVTGVIAAAVLVVGCNPQRQQECDRLVTTMKTLDEGAPTADDVDRVNKQVEALNLQDQPLQIYATNYRNTLTGLSSSLRLSQSPSAPDGTDDVVKTQLKEARADSRDVQRYCAQ